MNDIDPTKPLEVEPQDPLAETTTVGYTATYGIINGVCAWCGQNAANLPMEHFEEHEKASKGNPYLIQSAKQDNKPTISETPDKEEEPLTKPHAGAPEGNANAEKFDTPEKRKDFFLAYFSHVSSGRSDDSFRYQGSGIKLLASYKKKYAIEFPTDMYEDAQAARLLFWEDIGIEGTQGKIKNYNSDSWKFNMQNRFKWKGREDITTDDKELPDVRTIVIDTRPQEEKT